MKRCLKLAAIFFTTCLLLLVNGAGLCAQPTLTRKSIAILEQGREVARIALPIGVQVEVSAVRMKPSDDGNEFLLSGDAVVSLVENNHATFTLQAKDLVLKRRTVSADEALAIRDLEGMRATDQRYRQGGRMPTEAEIKKQNAIDAANEKRLRQIVGEFGWPGVAFAGRVGAQAAFLVLQHSTLDTQKKYLPLLRAAVAGHDASVSDLALLEDRVRVESGLPQIYGTQVKAGSPPAPEPVEDEQHLDERREKVGLPPMAEYLKLFSLPPPAGRRNKGG